MASFDGLLLLVLTWAALGAGRVGVRRRPGPAGRRVRRGREADQARAGCAITGLALVVVYFFGLMSFFGLPAVIASIVYLVDVRPAVRGLRRGNTLVTSAR